jgi:hypothetical protein
MKGFILFSVLLMLQIFIMLGLYGVTAVRFLLKSSHHHWQRQKNEAVAQLVLHQIENHLLSHVSSCIIPTISVYLLRRYKDEWWNKHACHGHFLKNRYDYVVELLDKDSCSLINKRDMDEKATTEYYRISLRFLPSDTDIEKVNILLQSTAAIVKDEIAVCRGEWHQVILGRQMQRELLRSNRH